MGTRREEARPGRSRKTSRPSGRSGRSSYNTGGHRFGRPGHRANRTGGHLGLDSPTTSPRSAWDELLRIQRTGASSFRTVRKNTIQTAEDIPEDQYGFAPAEGTKTVAQTLVHIALSPQLQLTIHATEPRTTFEGFDFPAFIERLSGEEAKDRTKAQVIELLKTEGERWANFLEGVTEEFLAEPFGMPPGATPASKSRFEMLLSVKEHEMHHRGQLGVCPPPR